MKLGIMQPYFFPYLGYYSLIKYTDYFIIFDTPQYIRKGWVNRNRILDAKGDPKYITVPVEKAGRDTAILETKISTAQDWMTKIYGELTVYKKRAPYYSQVLKLFHEIEAKVFRYISDLNIYCLQKTLDYLEIPFHYNIYSKMGLPLEEVHEADEWALFITKALGYDTYVNPPGGISFFNKEKYEKNHIRLEFLKLNLKPYPQRNGEFTEGLSILDAMMFLKPEEVLDLLKDFTIIH